MHPWSAYLVVPVFGLANAGVHLDAESLSAAMTSRVTIGVAVALVVGNTVGIFGASALALRLNLGSLPGRVRYSHLLGGAMLAGIGFTISLFIAELAFDDEVLIEEAKIGILAGSLVAAVAGSVTLRILGERLPLCSPESPGRRPVFRRGRGGRRRLRKTLTPLRAGADGAASGGPFALHRHTGGLNGLPAARLDDGGDHGSAHRRSRRCHAPLNGRRVSSC
ncbi:Na+/H+ antiporter NhaA [Oerskovia sp. M15]